jgi:hypothetical protein
VVSIDRDPWELAGGRPCRPARAGVVSRNTDSRRACPCPDGQPRRNLRIGQGTQLAWASEVTQKSRRSCAPDSGTLESAQRFTAALWSRPDTANPAITIQIDTTIESQQLSPITSTRRVRPS